MVDLAHRRGVRVRLAPTTTEPHSARTTSPGRASRSSSCGLAFVGTDWIVKRGFDLVVSSLIVIVGSRSGSRSPRRSNPASRAGFLPRSRIGQRAEFEMLKFRTMRATPPPSRPSWRRTTRPGVPCSRCGRPAGDEGRVVPAPVLAGRCPAGAERPARRRMSLAPPRPLPIRDYRLLEDWHRKRYLVLPGMTGLWQIAGRPTSSSTTSCGSTSITWRTGRSGWTSRSSCGRSRRSRPGRARTNRLRYHGRVPVGRRSPGCWSRSRPRRRTR